MKAKNPFTKANMKFAGIKAVCSTFGALHFVAQGTADVLKQTEASIVHKIDKNISRKAVIEHREIAYKCKIDKLILKRTIAQEKIIKTKHAVARKWEALRHGPINQDMVTDEAAMLTPAPAV